MKVAFVVKDFPVVSEPFIVNQVADLSDRGITVDVFAFQKSDASNVRNAAGRYGSYGMDKRKHLLDMPQPLAPRLFGACIAAIKLLFLKPSALFRMALLLGDPARRGEVLSLKYFFWLAPFIGRKYDLVHCHYATFASKYLIIRELLGDNTPFITTLYGYDISRVIVQKGPEVYAPLHKVCSRYLAMSSNMRDRAIAAGFPADRVIVHPVSLDVAHYPFIPRRLEQGETVELAMIARPVPKKGIDDFLKALAILKLKERTPFHATLVGGDGGPDFQKMLALADSLGVRGLVTFPGEIPLEKAHAVLEAAHIYVQPSKTAPDGSME